MESIIIVLLLTLPIAVLLLWVEHINRKYERKIKKLKRLIYEVHDEVSAMQRDKKKENNK